MTLKYYEYISDSKVDMLLPQIPLALKQKLSAEVGIDIKIFSAKMKTEHSTLEERVNRLEAVTRYIMQNENVGSLAEPDVWIYGNQTSQFGYIDDSNKIVAFNGTIPGVSYLLAGSSGHLIGMKPDDSSSGFGFSFMPRLINALDKANQELEQSLDQLDEEAEGRIQYIVGYGDTREDNWRNFIRNPWKEYNGAEMQIEFLAKRLLVTGEPGKTALLATPLYVARVD